MDSEDMHERRRRVSDEVIDEMRIDVAVMKTHIMEMNSRDASISEDLNAAIRSFKDFCKSADRRISTLEVWRTRQISFWAGVMAVVGIIVTAIAWVLPALGHWIRAKVGF